MLIRIYDFAQFITISHGGVIEIYYNITWGGGLANLLQYYNGGGGGGLPDLLQYYIGGGLPNLLQYYIGVGLESLLQYYSFERKMEGYNPFSALN